MRKFVSIEIQFEFLSRFDIGDELVENFQLFSFESNVTFTLSNDVDLFERAF